MEKVKLEKKYFEAMEALDKRVDFKNLITYQVCSGFSNPIVKSLNELDTITFVNALQYGFELEKSPKEKVESLYKEINKTMNDNTLSDFNWFELQGKRLAIKELNSILNLGLNLSESDK